MREVGKVESGSGLGDLGGCSEDPERFNRGESHAE